MKPVARVIGAAAAGSAIGRGGDVRFGHADMTRAQSTSAAKACREAMAGAAFGVKPGAKACATLFP